MFDKSKGKYHDSTHRNQFGNQRKNHSEQNEKSDPTEWRRKNIFSEKWIVNTADSAMVEYSEKAGKFMAINELTNSKIRSIYGEIKRIQMGNYEEEKAAFLLLRPKVAYALGRDNKNRGLTLFKYIFDEAANYVSDQKTFNNFCAFFEAILAYHKAFGGKD